MPFTRWVLTEQDLDTIRSHRATQEQTVEITKKNLEDHLGEEVTEYIMESVNILADLQLPTCILLVLVLVAVFTRDGLFMDKQVSRRYRDNDFDDDFCRTEWTVRGRSTCRWSSGSSPACRAGTPAAGSQPSSTRHSRSWKIFQKIFGTARLLLWYLTRTIL